MNRTPITAAMMVLATTFALGCAGRGPSTPTAATTPDLVTHTAGVIRSGLPDSPCSDLFILPHDATGRHPRWLGTVADSVAGALRRDGIRAYAGRRPVGMGPTVRVTSSMSGSTLILHMSLDPGATGLGVARMAPPPEEETPGNGYRFRDRVWTTGPELPWTVLDARVVESGPDWVRLAALTPDGVRMVRLDMTAPALGPSAWVRFGAIRRVAAPPDYALLWWGSETGTPPDDPSRSLRVAASFLRSPGEIVITPGDPGPGEARALDLSTEVRLGAAAGVLDANGIGVVLAGAPAPLADRPLTGWAERDGVYLAIDVDGNLSHGDRRGLWARPAPGYGPVLLDFDDGWVATRDTDDGVELVHAVVTTSRRLEVTDRVDLGPLRVRAMESVDLNRDHSDDLLLVVTTGGVDRVVFFLTDGEDTR